MIDNKIVYAVFNRNHNGARSRYKKVPCLNGGIKMKAKYFVLAVGAMCSLFSGTASAQLADCGLGCSAPIAGPGSVRSVWATKFFAGLQWNFGDSRPELVLGVRRSETNTSNHVAGGKADLAVPLTTQFAEIKPVLRIMGLYGNRDVQAEFGFGMRAFDWKPLAGAGVQAPHANGGLNYVFADGFKAYAGANTLARAPAALRLRGPLSCPGGLSLTPVAGLGLNVDPSAIVDGYTCTD